MVMYQRIEYATWLRVRRRVADPTRGRAYPARLERLVKAIGVLVASALMLACDVRVPTRLISTTDAELYDMCLIASERWYDATGVYTECLYGASDKHLPMSWGVPEQKCAAAVTSKRRILIRRGPVTECNERKIPYENHVAIVTHEMGHAMAGVGAGHAESGIMGRIVYGDSLINQASIDWLCETAECVWEEAE